MTDEAGGGRSLGAEVREGLWDVTGRLEENFRRVEAALRQIEMEGDRRLSLAAAAELRQHIALAEKVMQTAISAEGRQKFQETILKALDESSPELRRRVMEILNERAGEAADREKAAMNVDGSDKMQ